MARNWPTWPPAPKIYGGIFDYDAKSERLRTVNASLEDPTVWNDPKKAQELGKEKKALDGVVVTITNLTSELADNLDLFEMSKEEGDDDGVGFGFGVGDDGNCGGDDDGNAECDVDMVELN